MLITVNLPKGYPAGQARQTPEQKIVAQRKALEDSIDDQRIQMEEDLSDNCDWPAYFATEKLLDAQDPRVAESKARGWRNAAFALVGGAVGALAGAQGGWTGALTNGLAVGVASGRGIHKHEMGWGETLSSSAFFGGMVGALSAVGGTFGAVVGGIAGAAVAANVPKLLSDDV